MHCRLLHGVSTMLQRKAPRHMGANRPCPWNCWVWQNKPGLDQLITDCNRRLPLLPKPLMKWSILCRV
jgi:hypothetical protein